MKFEKLSSENGFQKNGRGDPYKRGFVYGELKHFREAVLKCAETVCDVYKLNVKHMGKGSEWWNHEFASRTTKKRMVRNVFCCFRVKIG